MEPIVALLALVAQLTMRQDAIVAALEKKGLLAKSDIEGAMPKTEAEVGRHFDKVKRDFFELWSKFDDEDAQ